MQHIHQILERDFILRMFSGVDAIQSGQSFETAISEAATAYFRQALSLGLTVEAASAAHTQICTSVNARLLQAAEGAEGATPGEVSAPDAAAINFGYNARPVTPQHLVPDGNHGDNFPGAKP